MLASLGTGHLWQIVHVCNSHTRMYLDDLVLAKEEAKLLQLNLYFGLYQSEKNE